MLCVLIRFEWVHSTYNHCVENKKISLNYRYLLPELVPWLTLSGSNYLCLEWISMVRKMFEPLKFDCILLSLKGNWNTFRGGDRGGNFQNWFSLSSGKRLTLKGMILLPLSFLMCRRAKRKSQKSPLQRKLLEIWEVFQVYLTLKMPRKPASENVLCLCRLLNILANFSNLFLHTGKQCRPWSDCS